MRLPGRAGGRWWWRATRTDPHGATGRALKIRALLPWPAASGPVYRQCILSGGRPAPWASDWKSAALSRRLPAGRRRVGRGCSCGALPGNAVRAYLPATYLLRKSCPLSYLPDTPPLHLSCPRPTCDLHKSRRNRPVSAWRAPIHARECTHFSSFAAGSGGRGGLHEH